MKFILVVEFGSRCCRLGLSQVDAPTHDLILLLPEEPLVLVADRSIDEADVDREVLLQVKEHGFQLFKVLLVSVFASTHMKDSALPSAGFHQSAARRDIPNIVVALEGVSDNSAKEYYDLAALAVLYTPLRSFKLLCVCRVFVETVYCLRDCCR